jgi:DNA-binding NtrC family response regulator
LFWAPSPREQGSRGGVWRAAAAPVADFGVAHPLRFSLSMNAISETASPSVVASGRSAGYHGAVCDFKRRLIEATLHQMRGNRTHTARVLGLQRTYLLR